MASTHFVEINARTKNGQSYFLHFLENVCTVTFDSDEIRVYPLTGTEHST